MSDQQDRLTAISQLSASKTADLTEVQQAVYLSLLADIPSPLLLASCVRLAKAQTYGMPSVAEVRAMADQVQLDAAPAPPSWRAALPAAPESAESDPRTWVHCQTCQDEPGAWVDLWCRGIGKYASDADPERVKRYHVPVRVCGDSRHHGPHSFVERCECHRAPWREAKRAVITKYSEDRRETPRRRQ